MKVYEKTFIFKSHNASFAQGEAFFNYTISLGGKIIDFTEKISFPPIKDLRVPQSLINNILDNLLLILGVSYWKLYCPKDIVLESISLTKDQANFWNTVYTKGMGEFFYKNNIDFRGLIKFPFDNKVAFGPVKFSRKNRSLVGIGGGKDSIVSAELLKQHNKQFDLITSSFPVQIEVANMIGGKAINTKREIDSKLLEMNKQNDVYNGHIPISVYYAFLTLFIAVLFDYRYIIVSNERSANYGNVEYLGEVTNHQWSKSFEFEKLFQDYVAKYITEDIHYFSLLKPLYEIKIVKLFAKYKKYFSVFSSCNTNFKINMPTAGGKWCGKCAKCVFIFTLFSAFVDKKDLLTIFGKNLFEDKTLLVIFEELLGIKNFKPFECIGTPEEMQFALYLAHKKKTYNSDVTIRMFIKKVLPKIKDISNLEKRLFSTSSQNLIPESFQAIVKVL